MIPNKKDICYDVFLLGVCLVNHREVQVETLFEALEELDPKLEALGILKTHKFTY